MPQAKILREGRYGEATFEVMFERRKFLLQAKEARDSIRARTRTQGIYRAFDTSGRSWVIVGFAGVFLATLGRLRKLEPSSSSKQQLIEYGDLFGFFEQEEPF